MPVLSNPRHEKFVQLLAEGRSADEAYVLAGYKQNRHNAAALAREEHISTRLRTLQEHAAERTAVTIESLTDELEEARAIAIAEKQSSAAVAASMGKAKLHGFLIEKKQLSGANGGPVQIADVTRLKGMTNEELKILERALVQIGLAEGDTSGTGEPED
jgi:hypothetical protein